MKLSSVERMNVNICQAHAEIIRTIILHQANTRYVSHGPIKLCIDSQCRFEFGTRNFAHFPVIHDLFTTPIIPIVATLCIGEECGG